MLERVVLLLGKLSAVLRAVGNAKVSKHTLRVNPLQGAGLFYFFYRIIISRKLLTHKADSAHTGVELDVSFNPDAVLCAVSAEQLGVIERINSLSDVKLKKLA